MVSEHIGRFFAWLRDGTARGLLRLGARPNHMTVLGMLLTVGAGVAVAAGRPWWPLAVGLIVGAGGCDMLDGALAKLGRMKSRFGGVFDSFCDRISDAGLYLGPAFYFIVQPDAGPEARPNLTLVLLAAAGLVWAYLVSYTRARTEDEAPNGGGGFWQRGERVVTIFLGLAFGHLATAVWILGLAPLTTVAHRLWRARRACRLVEEGRAEEVADLEPRGVAGLLLWRYKRGSLPFDVHAGTVIALLVFVDIPAADPLRSLLGS